MKRVLCIYISLLLSVYLCDTSHSAQKYQKIRSISLSEFANGERLVGTLKKGLDDNIYVQMDKNQTDEYLILKFGPSLKYQSSFKVDRNLLLKQKINRYFDPIDFCVDANGIVNMVSNNYIVSFDGQGNFLSKYALGSYFIERIVCKDNGFLILAGANEDFTVTPENEHLEKEITHEIMEFVKGKENPLTKIPLMGRMPPMGSMVVAGNNIFQIRQRVTRISGSAFIGGVIVEPLDYYEVISTSKITGKTQTIKIPSKMKDRPLMAMDVSYNFFSNKLLVILQPRKVNEGTYIDILSFRGERLNRIQLKGLSLSRLIAGKDGIIIGTGYKVKNAKDSEGPYLFHLRLNEDTTKKDQET